MRLEDRYDSYVIEGKVRVLDSVDSDLLLVCFKTAADLAAEGKKLAREHKAKCSFFDVLEKMHGALEQYSKGLLLAQKVDVNDPEALFLVVCVRYPALELDWHLLDNIRVKVAAGGEFKQADWKRVELAVTLFLSAMKGAAERLQ